MKINVNPNRMELLKLKKRLVLARRGHKLLKDKQEELMRQFILLIKDIREKRGRMEEGLSRAFQLFMNARINMDRSSMEGALALSDYRFSLNISQKILMNLRVPDLEYKIEGSGLIYGLVNTAGDLDQAMRLFERLFTVMLELGEKEKAMELLSYELETTRRRVNALEYILIPNLKETIKFIADKLNEIERSNISRLMKVKEIVRSH